MSVSENFVEKANLYTGTISEELEKEMISLGWAFLRHSWINDGRKIPNEDAEELIDALGGTDILEASFSEKDPAFSVRHISSNTEATDNGGIVALCKLWVLLKKAKVI